MTKYAAVQQAIEELEDVQFIGNTWHEAAEARKQVVAILCELADALVPAVAVESDGGQS